MPRNNRAPRSLTDQDNSRAGSFGRMDRKRDPNDLYETPIEAVEMLFTHHEFEIGSTFVDPSCGRGNLLMGVMQYGPDCRVYGFDKFPQRLSKGRREALGKSFIDKRVDFLRVDTGALRKPDYLIFNPPYRDSDAHVRHAMTLMMASRDLTVAACVMLPWNWITAKRRKDLLQFLSKIIICGRCKMLPPGVEDKGFGGMRDFAWFIFEPRTTNGGVSIIRA